MHASCLAIVQIKQIAEHFYFDYEDFKNSPIKTKNVLTRKNEVD